MAEIPHDNTIKNFSVLNEALYSCLSKYNLINEQKNICIALSGGADSVALLYSAYFLKEKYKYNLTAVHVEHGIRGNDSINDAKFVENLCESLDVPLYLEHVKHLNKDDKGLENKARIARYNAFENAIKHFKVNALIVSHHADDNVETFLMNLFRGAGTSGLIGIKDNRKIGNAILLRPFISINKSEILKSINNSNIKYRDDETNFEDIYTRNKLRLNIIPQIADIYPSYRSSIEKLSEIIQIDEEYFGDIVYNFIKANTYTKFPYYYIKVEKLKTLHKSIVLRVLRQFVINCKQNMLLSSTSVDDEYSLSFDSSIMLYNLLYAPIGTKIEITGGLFFRKSMNYIHCTPDVSIHSNYKQNNGLNFNKAPLSQNVNINWGTCGIASIENNLKSDGKLIQAIPNHLINKIVVREKEPEDIIRPFGMTGKMSLKKYFINKKIDIEFRDYIPIIAIENNVLWVVGVGSSNDVKIDGDIKNTIFQVNGHLPWLNKEDLYGNNSSYL